ncbi:MAG: class E sortase [Acidimicrobiales bacterium]
MLRTTLAVVGRLFLAAGTLLGLFVAYLLWGTGLSEAHSQAALAHQFHAQAQAAKTAGAGAYTPVLPGYAIGIIQIPKIHLEKYLVEGTNESDLQKGPGHYTGTPLPGQPGNVAIAGHRTTYGAPFYNLDQLKPGDPVRITMLDGTTYTYDVTCDLSPGCLPGTGHTVVSPSDVAVVGPAKDNRLTLTTCNPRFSASTRLIVTASLVGAAAPAPATPASSTRTQLTSAPTNLTSGQSRAIPAIVLFAVLGVAVWLTSWAASRRVRWWAWVGGTPVFLVVLYFFFENLVRILPASV